MHPKVCEAAKSGDYDSLITIISGNGEDLFHQTTPKENNILHLAAQYKQVNFIENLLQCPSGPSLLWQGNCKGDTPLHVAAKVGSCEAVQMFIDLSKSLHWVIENGQVDACKELLRKQNLHKDTVLHYAIRGGHDLVVELLIGEEPQLCDITNAAFESPLYLAADRGLSRTIDLILGTPSLSSSHKGPKGLTALHAGISHSLTGWEIIMENRPEAIKEADDLGWTPLHYVAYLGKVEAVRLLLQRDTSVAYDLDKGGESALHLAAFQGCVNVIDELVRSCPDACDIINTKGQSALHVAAIGGQENVVNYILGMPNMEDLINEQDNDGNTALHLAALHKKCNIICIFAQDKRVDRLAKNKDHFTALDIFSAHKEVDYKANKVHHLLKGSHGIPGFQGWFIEYGKKRLDKQFVLDRPSVSITTRSNIPNQDNFDLSKKGIMDVQLLVAGLIATVTFAVAFTMPGGYNNDGPDRGMAIFAKRASFKAFVMCNTCSFLCSIIAIILHCESTMFSYRPEPRHIPTVGCCIEVATVGMMMSYGFGLNTVLHRPNERIGESIAPYYAWGVLFSVSLLYHYPDHEAHSWVLGSSPKRYIRRFLFKCGMPLLDWSRGKLMSWAGSTFR
ncbi:ankyrin repeat-containing protein At5g02620-like [Eucalyptus grandis]|uniref:ankyrin repeat-containing protein At5g02620-like n=1 Tax=Eucalyptus grandis TaxID=71139 RepID=UPI00192E7C2B|nr:ankyrin repeat-containing protein At5g02620-like [Eucalyptus grandis]